MHVTSVFTHVTSVFTHVYLVTLLSCLLNHATHETELLKYPKIVHSIFILVAIRAIYVLLSLQCGVMK